MNAQLLNRLSQHAEVAHERNAERKDETAEQQPIFQNPMESHHNKRHKRKENDEEKSHGHHPCKHERLVKCDYRNEVFRPQTHAEYERPACQPKLAKPSARSFEIADKVE